MTSQLTESTKDSVKEKAQIDALIERLMLAPLQKKPKKKIAPIVDVSVSLSDISLVTRNAIASFREQSSLLRIKGNSLPIHIFGDIHGQFRDLRIMLSRCGDPSAGTNYLFLGDYVDRGVQGVETVLLLFCLKIRYPSRVFLLRGNHEDCNTATTYGFYDECYEKFAHYGEMAWTHFIASFNMMPVAALVGDRVLCMHGGLSPTLNSLEDITNLPRPSIIPPYGLMCDLLWSDPDNKRPGWSLSGRGISFTFDDSVIEAECARLGIDLIVRAHQINQEMFRNGYKFFANGLLVSIFSAPNYLNMLNDSCVLRIDETYVCHFIVFRPKRDKNIRIPKVTSAELIGDV